MKRRNFIQTVSGASAAAYLAANQLLSSAITVFSDQQELDYHTIVDVSTKKVRINYPRFVSKNAIKGNHGWGYDETICELVTDKGAKGWGVVLWGRPEKEAADYVTGKNVSELFQPGTGLTDPKAAFCDIALHDLAGQILRKTAYVLHD